MGRNTILARRSNFWFWSKYWCNHVVCISNLLVDVDGKDLYALMRAGVCISCWHVAAGTRMVCCTSAAKRYRILRPSHPQDSHMYRPPPPFPVDISDPAQVGRAEKEGVVVVYGELRGVADVSM